MNASRSPGDAQAEAAQWYARLKTVPLPRQTLEEYFAWQRIEGHAEAFDAVDRFYAEAGEISARPAIIAAVGASYHRPESRQRKWASRASVFAGIAAVVLVGAGLSGRWLLSGTHYATRVGEQREVALEDGSKVILDTDTHIAVRYTKGARTIVIDHGQAYFSVIHDPGRSFIVEAGSTTVIDTGTQFDVRRIGEQTDITLVRGSVAVKMRNEVDAQLRPGQRLHLEAQHEPRLTNVDPLRSTAWTRGRIILDGVLLGAAIIEVNRYTTRPVILDATRYRSARLSGSLDAGDVPGFIAAVTAILPLKTSTDASGSVHLAI